MHLTKMLRSDSGRLSPSSRTDRLRMYGFSSADGSPTSSEGGGHGRSGGWYANSISTSPPSGASAEADGVGRTVGGDVTPTSGGSSWPVQLASSSPAMVTPATDRASRPHPGHRLACLSPVRMATAYSTSPSTA